MAIFSFNSCRFALVLAAACSAATTATESQKNTPALRGNVPSNVDRKLTTQLYVANLAIQEQLAVHGGAGVEFGLPATTIYKGNVCANGAVTGKNGTDFILPEDMGGKVVAGCNPMETGFFGGVLHAAALTRSSTPLTIGEIGTRTLTPGVYSSASISIAANTQLVLDGAGSYIFQSGSTLVTGANSFVHLVNGATSENVLWVTGGAVTTGANSVLEGSIMSGAAITLGAITKVTGVVLAKAAVSVGGNCQLNTAGIITTAGNVVDTFPDADFIFEATLAVPLL
jgi:hypothetical protein